jgi:hypothetical protein
MLRHFCVPYRGYSVLLHVATIEPTWFEGEEQRRYVVSWTVKKEGTLLHDKAGIESFTESSRFTSVDGALDFGERRAHTFVDGIVAASPRLAGRRLA